MNATKSILLSLGMAAVALTGCTWGSEAELPYESGERITEITIGKTGDEFAATKTVLQRNGQTWWDEDGSFWGGKAGNKTKDKVFFIRKCTGDEAGAWKTTADYRQAFEFSAYYGSDKRKATLKLCSGYNGLEAGAEYYGYYYPRFCDGEGIPTAAKPGDCQSYNLAAQDDLTIQKYISYNDIRQLVGGSSNGEGGVYVAEGGAAEAVKMPCGTNLWMESVFAIIEVDVTFKGCNATEFPFNILHLGCISGSAHPFASAFYLNDQGYWDSVNNTGTQSSFVECFRTDRPVATNSSVIKYLFFVKQTAAHDSYYLRLITSTNDKPYNCQIDFNTKTDFMFKPGNLYYITLEADLSNVSPQDATDGPKQWQNSGKLNWKSGLKDYLVSTPAPGVGSSSGQPS